MLKSIIPEHLHKDWLLHFSGFFTWSLISFLSLNNLALGAELLWKSIAFISFYVLFYVTISTEPLKHPVKDKLLIAAQLLILLILIKFDKYDVSAILLVLVATQLAARFTRRQAMLIMVLSSSLHFLIIFDGSVLNSFFRVVIYFMLQIFGFSAIESALREAKAKEELSAINQELVATRFMLKQSSQKQERLRISRDLHDVIGHQLTGLALNLEVASHKVPAEFKPILQQNVTLAKTLLFDVREVVKEMRQEAQFDLVEKLSALIAQLPKCQFHLESTPIIESLSLKQQLMFCLQEAVSNAIRHGKANTFTLKAVKDKKQLTLSLVNNGSSKINAQFGSGLLGMQERLANFNGQVDLFAIEKDQGCCLQIKVEDNYD